jgi:glycosyltransferase involved in cell wall biosynthesis
MAVANGFNERMVDTISTVVRTRCPEIIHCEHFHMWQVVSRALTNNHPPVLLAEQGVEFLVTERFLKAAPTPWHRLGLWLELVKAKRWERDVCRAADGVVVVSADDQKVLLNHVPGVRTWIVENGVDPEVFAFVPEPNRRDRNTILFLGTFSFFGNRDALRYICSEILPAVRRRIPGAVLKVVGERPPAMGIDGVELLGAVPDVVPYLQSARVLLAPLRTGSGTKLKILEAMACGLPFITTDLGIEGLADAIPAGLVGRDTEAIIEATVQILTDDDLARDLGRRGRQIVESRYTWERSARALELVWEEMSRR